MSPANAPRGGRPQSAMVCPTKASSTPLTNCTDSSLRRWPWGAGNSARSRLSAGSSRLKRRLRPRLAAFQGDATQNWPITGFYFFHGAVAAIVSHGIVKERAVPPKEIDRALGRKKRFEANPAKHRQAESTE